MKSPSPRPDATRLRPGGRRAPSFVRLRLETGLDHASAAARVDDVDGLVLAVRPRDPEPHRGPAPEAELPLFGERAGEDERSALQSEVASGLLADAVDVDLELLRDVGWQFNPRLLGHVHRMPCGCAGSC